MSFTKVKPAGWGANEILTSTQMNSLDADHANSLDKTSAGDTLSGAVVLSGAGRLLPSLTTGANADTTYTAGGGNTIIKLTSAITANRVYTLSHTSAATNDVITIYSDPGFVTYSVRVLDGGGGTLAYLGNISSVNGKWASFIYTGSAWTVYQQGQGSRFQTQSFTSSGSFTVPQGVTVLLLHGCGGGGGGGGSADSPSLSTGTWYGGAGGGGGALFHTEVSTVTAGSTYTVTIGAGGTGGVAGGGIGNDGGTTSFGFFNLFVGGQGGANGAIGTASVASWSHGGAPVAGSGTRRGTRADNSFSPPPNTVSSAGGYAYALNLTMALDGMPSPRGPVGGQCGIHYADPGGGGKSGGPGGGGGAGPFGNGGDGGDGVDGNGGGPYVGVAGTSVGGNSGSGGGGAGGPAAGITGYAGAAGGDGSKGLLYITWSV